MGLPLSPPFFPIDFPIEIPIDFGPCTNDRHLAGKTLRKSRGGMTRVRTYRSVSITRFFMKIIGLWHVETRREQLLLRAAFGYAVWAIVFAILVEGVDLYHCIGDFYVSKFDGRLSLSRFGVCLDRDSQRRDSRSSDRLDVELKTKKGERKREEFFILYFYFLRSRGRYA